jgi:hypothetical protein
MELLLALHLREEPPRNLDGLLARTGERPQIQLEPRGAFPDVQQRSRRSHVRAVAQTFDGGLAPQKRAAIFSASGCSFSIETMSV